MKKILNLILVAVVAIAILFPAYSEFVYAAQIKTTPTGYTQASDVVYKKTGQYIHNWGARGEVATFLSPNAQAFYTKYSASYDVVSKIQGGSTQSNAPQSSLYKELQSIMKKAHSHETNYQETRYQYCYTDCVLSNSSKISSFYSGEMFNSTWDSGATWNREHTWPNSKGDESGNGENDIMMLRPTLKSENGSRGNDAYGESGGYYDPGVSVRGDCARIVLYVYTRWNSTSRMWGTSGVMENLTVLLRWMQEDPVDTWEMGRNDAVQSITGTRNIFVDYPEYAFLLFGQAIPSNMPTPSKSSAPVTPQECEHVYQVKNTQDPTYTQEGFVEKECLKCGDIQRETIPVLVCEHNYTEVDGKEPTSTEDGYVEKLCIICGKTVRETIPATGECEHNYIEVDAKEPTATEDGYVEKLCVNCGETVRETLPATGETQDSSSSVENSVAQGGSTPASCQSAMSGSYLLLVAFATSLFIISKKKFL